MQLELAFEEWQTDMLHAMTAFCRDGAAAEDAVQHAFTQGCVHRAMLELMPDKAMRAWLFTTARNHLIDLARRRRRLVFQLDETLPDPQPDPTDRLLAESLLATLPEALEQVVRLRYYAGLNSTQIGQALGLPPATVRARLRKAIQMMHVMTKEEVT